MTRTVVVGGGIMGAGIAYEARVAGFPVTLVEAEAEFLEAAADRVGHYEQRARGKGAELEGFGSLDLSTDLAAVAAEADVIVEAVSEDLALKSAIFETAGAAASDTAVLASNTSGLPIEVLGAASGRPTQVVGLHFFNPVPAMRLVEVIRGVETSEPTLGRALDFAHALGKQTVQVRDLPGFVTTRLGVVLLCEAIRTYEQGVASAADLDTAMKLGWNHPMGPLELADRIGLDTILSICDDLRGAWGDAFRAPPLLRQMVAAGKLGRKSGRGFYDYFRVSEAPATAAFDRPWTRRFRYGWLVEAGLGVAVYFLYDDIRERVAGSSRVALANARDLIRWEKALGIYQELRVQRAFIDWGWFLSIWNIYYGTIHFVMPVIALVLLWRHAPRRYIVWRNTLLVMLVIGLALFWAYPLMPPRLMPQRGFVDTAAEFFNFGPQQRVVLVHGIPDAASRAAFGNLFAAMPSFHAGWSMWSALAMLPVLRSWWAKALVLLDVVLTVFAIVVTANHWILDAVGGWAVLALSWALVTVYERWRHPTAAADGRAVSAQA